jgi:hypothetical protein
MTWRTLALPLVALLASLTWISACDENGETGAAASPCEEETRAMQYSAGLSVDGDEGVITASLMDASPAPPARYVNDWTLAFSATGAQDLEGMEVEITPWMPDHGHGTAAPITIEDLGGGEFTASGIDLFMVGYWEVHIDLTAADESWSDRATFAFCVE